MSRSYDFSHALTLWQPVATAMIPGPKGIENRMWPPPANFIGQRIWLHAGKVYDAEYDDLVSDLWPEVETLFPRGGKPKHGIASLSVPMGAIVGHARVAGWVRSVDGQTSASQDAFLGLVEDQWFFGPYGWVLTERVPLKTPVASVGHQKLWAIDAELRQKLRIAFKETGT